MGCARFSYNYCKRLSDKYYKLFGKSVSQLDLQKHFTKMKKRKKYKWLHEINAQVPKQASKDFEKARKNSFSNYNNGYHTRYKSRKDLKQGFYADYDKIRFTKKGVILPSVNNKKFKFGVIKTSQKLPIDKCPSNPRVKFDGRYWWLSVGFETFFEPQDLTQKSIGVDVGLKEFYVDSNHTSERNINKDAKVKNF